MKIAFVCNTLSGGGAERFTANISNRFCQDLSNTVYVITGKKTEKDYSVDERVHREEFLSKNLVKDFNVLKAFLKKESIDVVVGIDIYPNLVVSLCSKFTTARCIISERNAPKQVSISKLSKLLRFIVYRFADGYVFQTNGAKEFYSKSIQKRSVVIHNPVRDNLPYKTAADNKEIVAAGRLMPQKNYAMLIRSFAEVVKKHSDYKLRIFGQGKLLGELQALVTSLNLDGNVVFEGFCLNVHEAIKDSQIYVMSSDYEGMPNALMEAMAMGFPVISTDCPSGGPSELITDGVNGLLCKTGDSQSMADCINRLIESHELCSVISENAKKIYIDHSSDVIISQWKDFINA